MENITNLWGLCHYVKLTSENLHSQMLWCHNKNLNVCTVIIPSYTTLVSENEIIWHEYDNECTEVNGIRSTACSWLSCNTKTAGVEVLIIASELSYIMLTSHTFTWLSNHFIAFKNEIFLMHPKFSYILSTVLHMK